MTPGISGSLTRAFIGSPLTPLLLLTALALGLVALVQLPREEEPQISVPMVDILVAATGLPAADVVELVTEPLEDIVKGIRNVEHVYSMTEDDQVAVTVRFDVGTDEDLAIWRVHEAIRANIRRIPVGIPEPLIVGRGIDDVPILALTLWPRAADPARWADNALHAVAEELQHELSKVDNIGGAFIVGGRPDQIRVEPDPDLLALYGVTLNQLVDKVANANRAFRVGDLRSGGRSVPVLAGQTLHDPAEIGRLLITSRDGRPVYVKDVARVVMDAVPGEQRAWHMVRAADGSVDFRPAVTVAFAKRAGANAVVVAESLLDRLRRVEGTLVPADVAVTVTRDYGATATEKSDELLFHLGLATLSIVGLIAVALGWREGAVVLVVVPTTILLTLFATWLMGYTINRVSLFALIFSIGILVDDAIVVIENIVRHWRRGGWRHPVDAAVEAVAEVGNPTIVATLTIVAALLPMMFVSGLMGPYMSPIPANASAAMVFSFFVAVVVTPWLLLRMRAPGGPQAEKGGGPQAKKGGGPQAEKGGGPQAKKGGGPQAEEGDEHDGGRFGRFYRRLAAPLLAGRLRPRLFLAAVGLATLAVCVLFATRDVTVKLLPFDNKSELQVVVDLAEGRSLETTERVLRDLARRLVELPELTSAQVYVGTAAPFNFNGLVRHSYLRERSWQGDIQVNLAPKDARARQSHEIALAVRHMLAGVPLPEGAALKVVEVPPGPPVMATLMAEVYGPDAEARRAAARQVRRAFESVNFVVDVDDSFGTPFERLRIAIDQENLEFHGVQEQTLYDTLAALLGGARVGYSLRGGGADPVEIAVRLPKSGLTLGERLLATPLAAPGEAADTGAVVELGDVVDIRSEPGSYAIFRRDGRFADLVTAELAGAFEAPIYGMLAVEQALAGLDWGAAGPPAIRYHGQPIDESGITLLWDGEWEVTYVTFRDMGAAFAVALFAIYLLVVAQFQSFRLPLVVLVPVPLTLIGVVLGHWLLGAPFTATSMIGFIALAGIIVRNSILLVDFIRHHGGQGRSLRDTVLEAGAIRFKPIFLTAAAAMIGAVFILADPIFQGLAISMVFGLLSSTALTVLVIPALYVWLRDDGRPATASGVS